MGFEYFYVDLDGGENIQYGEMYKESQKFEYEKEIGICYYVFEVVNFIEECKFGIYFQR